MELIKEVKHSYLTRTEKGNVVKTFSVRFSKQNENDPVFYRQAWVSSPNPFNHMCFEAWSISEVLSWPKILQDLYKKKED